MFTKNPIAGFTIGFDNGYEVSIQWGPMNSCSVPCRSDSLGYSVPNAEVAIFYQNEIVGKPLGWQSAEDVAGILFTVSNAKPGKVESFRSKTNEELIAAYPGIR
jgi:hypothetical protein